jgi:Zn-dependent M28 family amino/carboxypeptidase
MALPRPSGRALHPLPFGDGEEQGLLGSEYYAQHPLYPLTKTLADINIDGMQTAGPSRDLEVIGYGNSTIDDIANVLLKKEGRILVPDLQPEKGSLLPLGPL